MTKRRAEMTPEEAERAREVRRAGYLRNKDKELAYAAAYRDGNREKINAYARERGRLGLTKGTSYYRARQTPEQRDAELAQKRRYYQENRDAVLAYAAKYREKNYERLKAEWTGQYQKRKPYFDKYNAENYERIRARRLAWTEANWDRIQRLNAEWTQNNLDRHRIYQQRRRGRIRSAGGELSLDIVERLLVKQKGRCACCGKRLGNSYHLDHIVPLALGGANTDDNVQLLTPTCNLQKGAMHPVEFMQRRRGILL
jgi:5-methylcytosine-specific restriction endonuclease McrA